MVKIKLNRGAAEGSVLKGCIGAAIIWLILFDISGTTVIKPDTTDIPFINKVNGEPNRKDAPAITAVTFIILPLY